MTPLAPTTGRPNLGGEFLADSASNSTAVTVADAPATPDAGSVPFDFDLPREREADRPPEARGLARDEVRLLVATRGDERIWHARFRDLPEFLRPGDLLVVNTSATLPAAVSGRLPGGDELEVRFSTAAPQISGDEWWVVELRSAGGAHSFGDGRAGQRLALPAGGQVELVAPYMGSRLWLARFEGGETLHDYLSGNGQPIRYGYVPDEWPLEAYRTAFALEPGSAEMPSASRPFTPELVTRLVTAGVLIAPLTLDTGVSSPELGEPPFPERFVVPEPTAQLVNAARRWGGRVIAVGTTVVRALESVARPGGTVVAGEGWSSLVITAERGLRAIDGLLTGWHEPRASHLELLVAAAGETLLARSYTEALRRGYLWHEFGDSYLVLPGTATSGERHRDRPAALGTANDRRLPGANRSNGPRASQER